MSQNIRPDDADLYEGLVVLEQCPAVVGYVPHREGEPAVDPDRPTVKRPGHSLDNIQRALADTGAPPGMESSAALNGFDVFAGYLLLDALIANRDRHEENWAVLRPRLTGRADQLAPTYDHASSLGYNLSDDARKRMLAEPAALARWAEAGTAYRFEHENRPMTLVELAGLATAMCTGTGQRFWIARVTELDLTEVCDALRQRLVPDMSEAACKFAQALLQHNLGRLQDALARA